VKYLRTDMVLMHCNSARPVCEFHPEARLCVAILLY